MWDGYQDHVLRLVQRIPPCAQAMKSVWKAPATAKGTAMRASGGRRQEPSRHKRPVEVDDAVLMERVPGVDWVDCLLAAACSMGLS